MKWYNRHTMNQTPVVDEFWTQDIPLFHGVFTYYRNKPQPVRGKVHLAEERSLMGKRGTLFGRQQSLVGCTVACPACF